MKRLWCVIKWILDNLRAYFISISLIILLSTAGAICRIAMAIITKHLIDASVEGIWHKAIQTGVCICILVVVQIVLKGILSYWTIQTSEKMSNSIQNKLYLHLTKLRWMDVTNYHSGDLATRATSDVDHVVEGMVDVIPNIFSMGFGVIASFFTLFMFDRVLAVYAFLLGPAALLLSYLFGRKFMSIVHKAQEAESTYRSYLQESLEHLLVLKTFCCEEDSSRKLLNLQENKRRLVIRKNFITIITGALASGGFWFSYLIAFGWGALRLMKGIISFGTITTYVQLVSQIQSPFLELMSFLPPLFSTAVSIERLNELERLEEEEYFITRRNYKFNYIALEKVNFEYKEGNPILKNISTKIYSGDTIGLIGMSGEGKTTLLYLIMQLLKPVQGNIYYYCNNKKQLEGISIRNLISYVPQGNTLVSGTISDNLLLGCQDATKEEQVDALMRADAWEFVRKLPNGIQTVIGERALGISEGQAQRIAIARALLRKTPILLMDEATSALDNDTERRVLQSIFEMRPRRTCIIITHRPSILEYCNRIWRLMDGQLIEVEGISEVAASAVAYNVP